MSEIKSRIAMFEQQQPQPAAAPPQQRPKPPPPRRSNSGIPPTQPSFTPKPSQASEPAENPFELIEEDQTSPVLALTEKYHKILAEIRESEQSYQSEMQAVLDVYYQRAQSVLSPQDMRVIFVNLVEIVEFSLDFCTSLQACNERLSVVDILISSIPRMEEVYTRFCAQHDASIERIQELQKQHSAYFEQCARDIASRTTSLPDLTSMLLKPVQRVLKYPLFLGELKKCQSDLPMLGEAIERMAVIAARINESKRRREVVDKIVMGRSGRNLHHGLKKQLVRNDRQIKKTTRHVDTTADPVFEALLEKFELYQRLLQQLAKDVEYFHKACRAYMTTQERLALAWEDVYLSSVDAGTAQYGASIAAISEWRKLCRNFELKPLSVSIEISMTRAQEQLASTFQSTNNVIKKREKKLLDHDHIRDLKAAGDEVDKILESSALEYPIINAQLVEELPKLLGNFEQMSLILLGRFVDQVSIMWFQSLDGMFSKLYSTSSFNVVKEYQASFQGANVQNHLTQIPTLAKSQKQPLIRNRSSSTSSIDVPRNLPQGRAQLKQSDPDSSHGQAWHSMPRQERSKSYNTIQVSDAPLIDFGDDDTSLAGTGGSEKSTTSPLRSPSGTDVRRLMELFMQNPGVASGGNSNATPVSTSVSKSERSSQERLTKVTQAPTASSTITFFTPAPPTTTASTPAGFQVTAIYPFSASTREEMSVVPGSLLTVLKDHGDGWYLCRNNRSFEEGLVPASYCSRV